VRFADLHEHERDAVPELVLEPPEGGDRGGGHGAGVRTEDEEVRPIEPTEIQGTTGFDRRQA
jgi:hypothetical protein